MLAISCPAHNYLIPQPIHKLLFTYIHSHKAVCHALHQVRTFKVKHRGQTYLLSISCPAHNYLITRPIHKLLLT